MHTNIHAYTQTHIHTYIHPSIHTYIDTYRHTYVHAYIHRDRHTYINTYTHTYIQAYIHTYIHTYIQIYTYIRTYTVYINTYIHTYIHTGRHTDRDRGIYSHRDGYIYRNRDSGRYRDRDRYRDIHTYIHTYIQAYTGRHTDIHTYVQADRHSEADICFYIWLRSFGALASWGLCSNSGTWHSAFIVSFIYPRVSLYGAPFCILILHDLSDTGVLPCFALINAGIHMSPIHILHADSYPTASYAYPATTLHSSSVFEPGTWGMGATGALAFAFACYRSAFGFALCDLDLLLCTYIHMLLYLANGIGALSDLAVLGLWHLAIRLIRILHLSSRSAFAF